MNRKQQLALIWRHTHRDFRDKRDDGERVILVLRPEGTCSVPLSALTDVEIASKLPYAMKCEADRQSARNAKATRNSGRLPMAFDGKPYDDGPMPEWC